MTVLMKLKLENFGMGIKGSGYGLSNMTRKWLLWSILPKKNAPTLVLVGKGITFDS